MSKDWKFQDYRCRRCGENSGKPGTRAYGAVYCKGCRDFLNFLKRQQGRNVLKPR